MKDKIKEYLPIVLLIGTAMLAFCGLVALLNTVFQGGAWTENGKECVVIAVTIRESKKKTDGFGVNAPLTDTAQVIYSALKVGADDGRRRGATMKNFLKDLLKEYVPIVLLLSALFMAIFGFLNLIAQERSNHERSV